MTEPKYKRGQRQDENRMAFAAWLSTPAADRQPKTQRAFAKTLGVAHSTLVEWRRHPAVLAVLQGWRDTYKANFSQVVEALERKARKGDVPAARLLAEVLGELSAAKSEINVTETPYGRLLTDLQAMRKPLVAIAGGKAERSA
jgi:hypothetical protein